MRSQEISKGKRKHEEQIEHSKFIDFIKNPSMVYFIEYLPLFSFLIANYFILTVFDHFLELNRISVFILPSWLTFWIYYIIGLFLSLLVIKTNFMLRLKGLSFDLINFFRLLFSHIDNLVKKKSKLPKWDFRKVILMASRNLFFNVLNDVFILTIFWSSLFFLIFFLNLISIPNDFNFTSFGTAIGLIGILSGFFQFYTTIYREQTKDLISSITKYQLKIVQEISMDDFLEFLIRINERAFVDEIANRIFNTDRVVDGLLKYPGFRDSHITVYSLPSQGYTNSLSMFQYLDAYSVAFPQRINKNQLNNLYKRYFEEKIAQFKEKSNEPEISEIRKLILSTIVFSDEILSSLTRVNIDFPDQSVEPENFIDYYHLFAFNCVNILLDKIMNYEEAASRKTNITPL
ncbi:MAG: hypothetical protein A4E35_00752 [Methanoregula sp. PtaU1.Bin051]|nr:MAG: hypothetical protein A4E35_00752 [Methanoregula sp. PtaU1.Bin051]